MEEKLVKLEEKIDILTKTVEELSVQALEQNRNQPDQAVLENPSSSPAQQNDAATAGSTVNNAKIASSSAASCVKDIQGNFAAIKDAYQYVKLPSDLRLNENRSGVRREDQGEFNLVSRSARYIETLFKLLSQADGVVAEESEQTSEHVSRILDQIFTINLAHMRYIQEQYSNFIVQGTFDPTTSKIFRQLQRQSSGLSSEAIDTLHKAAGLAAVANRATSTASRPQAQHWQQPWRPRWGGVPRGRGRGYSAGRHTGQDYFNRYTQRQPFPQQRRDHERGTGD